MLTDAIIAAMEDTFRRESKFNCLGGMGMKLIAEIRLLRKELRGALTKGIRMGADVASAYDLSSSHPYRVSDCILGKLNVRRGKPRRNPAARELHAVISHIERKVASIEAMTTFIAAEAKRRKIHWTTRYGSRAKQVEPYSKRSR